MRIYVLASVQKQLHKFWWGKSIDVGYIYNTLLSALRADAHKGAVEPFAEFMKASPDALASVLSTDQLEKALKISTANFPAARTVQKPI
jgi:hypothetical protein